MVHVMRFFPATKQIGSWFAFYIFFLFPLTKPLLSHGGPQVLAFCEKGWLFVNLPVLHRVTLLVSMTCVSCVAEAEPSRLRCVCTGPAGPGLRCLGLRWRRRWVAMGPRAEVSGEFRGAGQPAHPCLQAGGSRPGTRRRVFSSEKRSPFLAPGGLFPESTVGSVATSSRCFSCPSSEDLKVVLSLSFSLSLSLCVCLRWRFC